MNMLVLMDDLNNFHHLSNISRGSNAPTNAQGIIY